MLVFSENVVHPGPDGTTVVGPAHLEIDSGMILSVTPGELPEREVNVAADHLDLGARLIAPAFVNAHTHLALASLRGMVTQENYRGNIVEELYFRFESKLSAEDVRAFVRVGALECLLSGTAVVWDHYYFADALVDGIRDTGLSAVVAPTLQDVSGPGVKVWESQLDATVRIAEDESLRADGIVAALGPHATDTVSDGLWQQIATVSERYALPIHAHIAQSQEELARSLSEHGAPTLERLHRVGLLDTQQPFLMVHGLYIGRDEMELLDNDRHILGFCPNAQMQFDFPAHVAAWRAKGFSVAVGTDAACCNDTMNVQLELRNLATGQFFAVPHGREYRSFSLDPSLVGSQRLRAYRETLFRDAVKGAAPEALLSSIWSTPGRLHPRLPCGVIAAGHRANLLVLDLDHPVFWPGYDPLRSLAFSNITPAIHGMMVNGKWVGTPGDFHRSLVQNDEARAFKLEADARLRGVLERAGLSPSSGSSSPRG